jgi:acetyl-CoA carboxylase carboxyl transferase subunit alpha
MTLCAYDHVQIARDKDRLKGLGLVHALCDEVIEMHGDRHFKDDPSMYCGCALIGSTSVMIIAQVKGTNTADNVHKNFGMNQPEGFRKAIRAVELANKLNIPIVSIVDTPGAYPGLGAEERGQHSAIAHCLLAFASATVPIITIVLSEGGSGGALALSIANHIMMFEHAIYSILSPEGFASILYKDASKSKEVAELMGLTSFDLKDKGIVDEIVDESKSMNDSIKETKEKVLTQLDRFKSWSKEELLAHKEAKFRKMGSDYGF